MTKYITLSSFLFVLIFSYTNGQIANKYPNDSLIGSDPEVLFFDLFEYDSLNELISNGGYQTSKLLDHIELDSINKPANTIGKYSLKLTTKENSTASNDINEDANILKKFTNGIKDSVFVRYYVKFNSQHTFHHSGVWIGGTNINYNCWPCNIPGRKIPTNGDSAFVVGSEIRGTATKSPQKNSTFGFYNYWMDMHPYTSGANANKYYGNEFISSNPIANIAMDEWNCIEIMIKLNNPVSESNGELKLWINGNLISHHGEGFPNGTWSEAFFNEGAGSPFEGFRFRSDSNVVLNYIWLKNYATNNDLFTTDNAIYYDNLVVAKNYIGPISPKEKTNELIENQKNKIVLYPNPTKDLLFLSEKVSLIELYDLNGKKLKEEQNVSQLTLENIENGIYTVKINNTMYKINIQK